MESFFSWLLIGGAFVVFKMRKKAKLVEQRRQIEEISKSNTKKTRITNKSPVKKKTVTKPPLIISPRVSSKSRSPEWVPKYDGPMFAKPGEKSDLFSYASYIGAHKIDAPFSLIDFETSGFQPDYARILEVAVIKIDSQGNILDEYSTLINPAAVSVHSNFIKVRIVVAPSRFLQNAEKSCSPIKDWLASFIAGTSNGR